MSTLTIVFTVGGLLTVLISIPLLLGRIPPNRWVGFGGKRTLEDQEIWYRVNAYAGKWLLGTGLWVIFAAFALRGIRHLSVIVYALGVLLVLGLLLGVGFGLAMRRYMKTL